MDGRMATAVAVLMLTASAVAAVPVGGTPSDDPGSFGASISAFMQSSAAETEGSVENGMWSAQFNHSDTEQREQLVESRSAALERKVKRLESERVGLLNGSDGEVSAQERAKAARLAARIESLNEAINDTQRAAEATGVNVTRLDELRTNASNLNGSEVSEIARGLAGTKKTATETDGLIDIPGLGGDGPPGQDKRNNSSNGDAPGKANRGNNSSENPGVGPGNSDQGRGNAGDADGSETPRPENNTSTPPQNETAARESGQRETDRRAENNGSDRRRGNGRNENVSAGSGSDQRKRTDGDRSANQRGRSGSSENASSSRGGSGNRSGNVSRR